MIKRFNQVKLSSIGMKNVNDLFTLFKVASILKRSGIIKQKGHSVIEMLFCFLLIMLENSKSVFAGMVKNHISNMKSPVNDMLNNIFYNWRDLLYRVVKRFTQLCPALDHEDCTLIFDDTSKVKTGSKTDFLSWFFDHCQNCYFKGYQNITALWSNCKSAIPIDFELKIGKNRTKHSRETSYQKGSHTGQRARFAKQSKTSIVISMIKRANQRRLPYKYILWDSWYNCSQSFSFVYKKLLPAGKVLISMLKNGSQKYKYNEQYLNLKQLYRKAGKWQHERTSGIKYKSLTVTLLDASGSRIIQDRTAIGEMKICFFKYPNVRKWKAIISTDTELAEIEVLKIYLRRWAVECVFKEIRQYFGYDQSKSSKYPAMVADLTIRYVFYIMFCYRKVQNENKPMGQIVLEFYQELFDMWLTALVEIMFKRYVKDFLEYALELGYSSLMDLRKDIDTLLEDFFDREVCLEKITESDKHEFRKSA